MKNKFVLIKNVVIMSVIVSGLILGTKEATAQDSQTITAATERPVEIEPITAPFDMPQLKRPQFPDRTFNITKYGAKNDGTTKNTKAFRKAIEACSAAGGGKVFVPAGKWLTGAIHLKSNVNLHFAEGAELHFSNNPNDYLPVVFTRWAGTEIYNYSSLIYANNCENIAITGPGKLFGHGENWWDWTRRGEETIKFIYENQVLKNVPPEKRIGGTPEDGLRPQFINPVNCKNVLFEGFTISAPGPFWTFDILYCENVIVRGLHLETFGGPNTDGINLNSTRNALVEYCYIRAGDDGVCLKSGINEDGWRVARPTENVVIRNITDIKSHGGIVIGSDMSGDVRNIFVHDCLFQGSGIGIRVKSNASRGGIVENIYYENIKMENIRHEAIRVETNYSAFMSSENGKAYPVFRNLSFNNITCNNADEAVTMQGTIHQPVENIRFENIDIKARRGMTFNWVNGLSLNNVHDEQVENPIIPPNALFTRSHKAGLESEYFNNKDLKGEPVFTRIDRQINFNYWAGNPPAPGVNHDKFSVRWKGFLKVPKSGTYKIGLEADEGFRLYLDNKLIIDAWENYKKGTFKGIDVQLEQEKFYDLKIEYFENLGFGYVLFSLKPGELKPEISDVYNQTDAKNINLRQKEYTSHSKDDALKWQIELRSQLFNLLKMDDLITDQGKPSLDSSVPITEDRTNYVIKELEINSTSMRRIKIIITIPKTTKKNLPAIVCIAGHGGNRLSVYEKESIYHGFATELAKKEFITISTDVGQHNVYESNRTLMGERLWDVMRCVDYLESLPMVDKSRIGCAGLSLGGEMAMWLGAMDQRIKVTVSSGFLTYMDQMEQNHCMCWKFDGLRELVDYPDIYSLIAPRFLQCQNGLKEPTNGFTPKLAKEALKEIKPIYMDFNKGDNVELVIHEGEHEIALLELLAFFKEHL